MKILVPVDGSDCSLAALEYGIEVADAFDAALAVVHITDFEDDAAATVCRQADAVLAEHGVDVETEVDIHGNLAGRGVSAQVGEHILDLVTDRAIDHVVMGKHGGSRLEKLVLGSASSTVTTRAEVPVTVVP